MEQNQNQIDIDPADIIHAISAISWLSSLDKALTKGGAAWIPVITGVAGHLLAAKMKKDQNQHGMAVPQF